MEDGPRHGEHGLKDVTTTQVVENAKGGVTKDMSTSHSEAKDDIVQPRDFWKVSWRKKAILVRDNITVEPMLVSFILSHVLAGLATQNLSLEKACRVNLAYSDQVCDALTDRLTANYTEEEREELVTGMQVWKSAVRSTVPAVFLVFVGSWTDRTGRRKPCMIIPIFGELLVSVGHIICTFYFYELPMEVAGVVESVFPALTGGWLIMSVGLFSYMADVTNESTRTFRMGITHVFISVSIPTGIALSAVLFKKIGFYGVFSLSLLLLAFSLWYGVAILNEEVPELAVAKDKDSKSMETPPAKKRPFLTKFFRLEHVRETFQVVFKKGENRRRTKVTLLLVSVLIVNGPGQGEMTVSYLSNRLRFNWDEQDFGMYLTFCTVVSLIGTSLVVGLFSKVFKIDDALLGVIGCLSKTFSSLVYAFATKGWLMYLGHVIDIKHGVAVIIIRSITSKIVPLYELGKVNALVGLCEAAAPVLYGSAYAALYKATISTLPGAFYLIGGALSLPGAAIFGWMYCIQRRALARGRAEDAERGAAAGGGHQEQEQHDDRNCNKAFDGAGDDG